jgi:hypothetical protein
MKQFDETRKMMKMVTTGGPRQMLKNMKQQKKR